ncbi:MAG: GNAT family N-acetyltransferase, partial [Chloroflexota bacterium]|nr:GNAT family N-acetyltransferase [Chloroflexota bacterium]
MSAIPLTLRPTTEKHLRPFDMRRDLEPAADLIELCFAKTLTADGRRYLCDMRSAANKNSSHWAMISAMRTSLPLAGFVWEEDGQVVGNLNLSPFFHWGRRIYLIANVAVNPNYRRRGIARALTKAALKKSHRWRAHEVWLHVQ